MTGAIARRPLGGTGEEVSILGVGMVHIGVPEEAEGIRIIQQAIDGPGGWLRANEVG
jgi:hypothetical protein